MHRAVLRLPESTVVEKLLKSIGDAVSFGEPIALVSQQTHKFHVPSPVNGHVVSLNPSGGAELGTVEGRKPSIGFRHLKNQLVSSASSSSSSAAQAPTPALGPRPPALAPKTSPGVLDSWEVPADFGRLPPLTPKESAMLHSGLASEEEGFVW
jgi:pyruvate/2-oxoglutarate dehydrogenase complex dihydrolipoamide acyltransferase (E2) component